MPRQLSTSVSDFILAVSACYVAHHWYHRGLSKAAIGIGIQCIAASFGVIRFAMENPEGSVIYRLHKLTSFLAATVGIPLIAVTYCVKYGSTSLADKIVILALCVVFVTMFLAQETRNICSQAVSGFSILTMCILCTYSQDWNGLGACGTYVIAGLVFGGDRVTLGIPNVDFLHYFLVAGNALFKLSL